MSDNVRYTGDDLKNLVIDGSSTTMYAVADRLSQHGSANVALGKYTARSPSEGRGGPY